MEHPERIIYRLVTRNREHGAYMPILNLGCYGKKLGVVTTYELMGLWPQNPVKKLVPVWSPPL